jgi:hypothetical protein
MYLSFNQKEFFLKKRQYIYRHPISYGRVRDLCHISTKTLMPHRNFSTIASTDAPPLLHEYRSIVYTPTPLQFFHHHVVILKLLLKILN